ncbi:kinase-like domain-containing protein [Mycena metata]|uniref:non-specific serine/threonine protein kinase n=1 Tax=Mycena metata TaxID=1033252 RepID=A0AAD7MXY5_9AGAR|nr:kinase-like domain-containing protein [Mycena metata]
MGGHQSPLRSRKIINHSRHHRDGPTSRTSEDRHQESRQISFTSPPSLLTSRTSPEVRRLRGGLDCWESRRSPISYFERISASELVEEERLPQYLATRCYPVRIGELFASRYQVVGKLGFGATSTVWLARDLMDCRHVALKIFIHSGSLGEPRELTACERLARGPKSHLGRQAVRTVLNTFAISGPDGEHHCLVHPSLWDSVKTFLARNQIGRLPIPVLAIVLQQVFCALDYARECRVIHTDINAGNIMFGIKDGIAAFEKFEQAELERPSPRKEIDGRFIYLSRQLDQPRELDLPVLGDFGEARCGEQRHTQDVQPDKYRSPEIWDMFEGGSLFSGFDPEHGTYRGRAHLAEMIALMGPPPPSFVAQGEFQAGIEVPPPVSLEQLETNLEGTDKELFLHFMSKMLQWKPQDRQTPKQLLDDPWLKKHTSG